MNKVLVLTVGTLKVLKPVIYIGTAHPWSGA